MKKETAKRADAEMAGDEDMDLGASGLATATDSSVVAAGRKNQLASSHARFIHSCIAYLRMNS